MTRIRRTKIAIADLAIQRKDMKTQYRQYYDGDPGEYSYMDLNIDKTLASSGLIRMGNS